MTLTEWANREINLACNFEKTQNPSGEGWDYGCACYSSAMAAFNSLMGDGHSGMSIEITKNILNRLIDGKPLTPIEDTDDVWNDISDISGLRGEIANYQCKRCFSLFKYVYSNGDVKYIDIDRCICLNIHNPSWVIYRYDSHFIENIIDEMFPITMPYMPYQNKIEIYIENFLYDPKNGDFDAIGIFYAYIPAKGVVQINRFFKESITPETNKHGFIEISQTEYEEMKKNAVRKDDDNE